MATKDITAEQLVAVLKFTPRTYTIQMWGYGGEKVMGTVDAKAWNYCAKNQIDLSDLAWDSDIAEELGYDEELLPFPPGSWYECDNMAHVSGVSRNAGTVQILDEKDEVVFERSLEACDGCDGSPEWACNDEVWVGMRKPGEVVFVGSSNEKGTFFEGNIELTAPFDIEKLQLGYDEVDGEEIINSVYYDGEEIDNFGGSTDGKSSDFTMVKIINEAGQFERYEPGETKPDLPESACDSETWDPAEELQKIIDEFDNDALKTDWFPAKVKPVHKGLYECEFATPAWPWPSVGMCEWTGSGWKENGEKARKIKQWRGLVQSIEYITLED